MAKLIRKVNQNRWSFLDGDDTKLSGDALSDMICKQGVLSFWRTTDDQSLEMVLTALSISSSSFDKLDYATIDESEITKLGIAIHNVPGNTAYEAANQYHVDLILLAVDDVSSLAKTIKHQGKMGRRQRAQVIKSAKDVKDSLNTERLSDNIRSALNDEHS